MAERSKKAKPAPKQNPVSADSVTAPITSEKQASSKKRTPKSAAKTLEQAPAPAVLKIVEDKPVEAPIAESPIEPIAEPIADKAIESPEPEASGKKKSEKSGKKMKRLTLDIPKSLHKAIKGRAVEEGAPMADMLRSLLEQHYKTPS